MENLAPWFVLKSVPGIGNHLFKKLYDHIGPPRRILDADDRDLLGVEGMTPLLVSRMKRWKMPLDARRNLELSRRRGYRIVTMADKAYPRLLHAIPDPPPFLYAAGRLDDPKRPIALVGSRNATNYGLAAARRLSLDLADQGFAIVSGMALGIDTAAHKGAIAAKGKTIAVLGSGLGHIYPAENRRLFARIKENGAVVSEFAPMARPEAYHFPMRNRIISGMSLGTVVVEAGPRSGSLITARLAAEQNREVFAVPGSIRSFKSTGTHRLIRQGAKLVENAGDVLEELPPMGMTAAAPGCRRPAAMGGGLDNLSTQQRQVIEAMGAYPVHIDDLVRRLATTPGQLSGLLLQLELKGLVQQSPGKWFTIVDEDL